MLACSPPRDRVWTFAAFRLEEAERRLTRNGLPLRVAPKALDLLILLLERAGRLVPSAELVQRLWPGVFVEKDTLARHVSSLRAALGDRRSRALIQTVSKSGYRLQLDADAPTATPAFAVLPFRLVGAAARDEALALGL